jgi:hypothetical protein
MPLMEFRYILLEFINLRFKGLQVSAERLPLTQ